MTEQRQFHRISLAKASTFSYRNVSYPARLENISLNGALISIPKSVIIPIGSTCCLQVELEGEVSHLEVVVEVVHTSQAMVGLKFISLGEAAREALINLLNQHTSEPETLQSEISKIMSCIDNYLRLS